MFRFCRIVMPLILPLILAALCLRMRGDDSPVNSPAAMVPAGAMPHIVLWAWEEPEDLRSADARRVGVAFLAERIFVDKDVATIPRRQPILVPNGIWAEAVVRIEAGRNFEDNEASRRDTANAVLKAAGLQGVRGVQVDFDATPSQRAFYSELLRRVRHQLPAGERLEMTALVSWCAQPESWMHTMPVDAAIPMYFRLGKHVGWWGMREPLCSGSVGVSTDEPFADEPLAVRWPRRSAPEAGRTVYVFAPRPWTLEQLALLNDGEVPEDVKGAR